MRGIMTLVAWAVVLTVAMNYISAYSGNTANKSSSHEIKYSQMVEMVEKNQVKEIQFKDKTIYITPVDGYTYTEEVKEGSKQPAKTYTQSKETNLTLYTAYLSNDQLLPLLEEHNVAYTGYYEAEMNPVLVFMVSYILPTIIMVGLFMLIMRFLSKSSGGGFGGIGNVGKSNAKVYMEKSTGVTFKDVAGQDEAKESLEEIIDFLHNPGKYTAIGAKLRKGALLVGSPGTGKTLLAKAVAGEAGVPFFSISGSDFVEMFVGVGASRVRDLFKEAAKVAPCIIFIDEIDTIGKSRDASRFGGNDEREQTLNQLLAELDGFDPSKGVIVLGATNRPEVLDKALLRAGRFDRQISVDLPDLNERKAIFEVHLRPIKKDASVDVEMLARQTPGFSGADIANVCNEAALIAARNGKKSVEKQDFLDAVDRIIGGLEKKTKVMTASEKRSIAIHEAGHATISWFTEHANPLVKVSIVPRGRALGAAWYMPEERQITTKEAMLDEICSLLGGRAAEELFTGHISTGAINDLERVTKSIYGMIAYAGMGENLPNISYYNNNEYNFQKPYSETTAKAIDDEALKMIAEQYKRAKEILTEHKEGHNALANLLIEREVIFAEDVEKIFGKRPWVSRSEEILEGNNASADNIEAETKDNENTETSEKI